MKVAVAQLGARMHYAVPRIFHEADRLERFFTDSYVGNKPWLERVLRAVPRRARPRFMERWLGRNDATLPPALVTSFERLGIAYVLEQRRALRGGSVSAVQDAYGARFDEAVLRHGFGAADTLWTFTGSTPRLLREAKRRGLRCLHEQIDHPFAVHRAILTEEAERWPGWQPGLAASLPAAAAAAAERGCLELADLVVTASRYTERALARSGIEVARSVIVPYGIELARWRCERADAAGARPLRVLYAGSLDLRKGVPYLLEALARLRTGAVEMQLAGMVHLAPECIAAYGGIATFLGPVPRRRMQELFAWADLFVFPTLGEGFGLVQVEAMAMGVPVIATTACGEVVREGVDGHVVPPRDVASLAGLLDRYATRPGELVPMAAAARLRAADFSFAAYARRLLAGVAAAEPAPALP